jgi:hypothetical protein
MLEKQLGSTTTLFLLRKLDTVLNTHPLLVGGVAFIYRSLGNCSAEKKEDNKRIVSCPLKRIPGTEKLTISYLYNPE